MGKFKDLTGMKFGRLTVIERAENKGRRTYWRCKCDCGAEVVIQSDSLTRGATKSCKCFNNEKISERSTTHGFRHTKIYEAWKTMKQRCLNPNCKAYKNYGGRGIRVCERWLDFQTFYDDVSQLEHFGEEGYSLDRINNDGDYTPENVRWADRKTQTRNRRNNIIVEYEGKEMTLSESAELSGLSYKVLQLRHKRGDRGDQLFRPVKS